MSSHERPLADPGREKQAALYMAEGLAADEWAARNAHGIGSWSFDLYRYSDPALEAWMSQLAQVFKSTEALAEARRRYLTPARIAEIEAGYDDGL